MMANPTFPESQGQIYCPWVLIRGRPLAARLIFMPYTPRLCGQQSDFQLERSPVGEGRHQLTGTSPILSLV